MLVALVLAAMLVSAAVGLAASRPRVVNGGTVQTPSEAPWVVRISIGSSNFCSGALVDASRVVTAAHCVVTDDGELRPSGVFTVVAGIVSTAADADVSTRQQRTVSAVRAHPGYERDEIINDVGQLTLSSPLDVTASAVKPIGLVPEGAGPIAGSTLRLVGWGATGDGGDSSDKRLHTLDLTQKPGWMCDSGSPSILCGTPPGNSSTCAGDSGAGLVTPSAIPLLAGVHSGQAGSPACQLNGISREMDVASPEIHQWLSGNDAPPAAARTAAHARLAGDPTVGETLECQPPPWAPPGSLDADFVDRPSGEILASGSTQYVVQSADVGRPIACVSVARTAGGATRAVSDNILTGLGRRPTLGVPATLAAPIVGRPVNADATASANDGRSLTSFGWDTTGDGVIDQPGGHLRLLPRSAGPLALAFVAADDAGAISTKAYATTVAPAPRIGVRLESRVRATILRRGVAGALTRPPSGDLSLTVSVGRLRQGKLQLVTTRRVRLRSRADVTRRFRLALSPRMKSTLRARDAAVRVRVTAIGYGAALAPTQISQRVRSARG